MPSLSSSLVFSSSAFSRTPPLQTKPLCRRASPSFSDAQLGLRHWAQRCAVGANLREVGYNCELAGRAPVSPRVAKEANKKGAGSARFRLADYTSGVALTVSQNHLSASCRFFVRSSRSFTKARSLIRAATSGGRSRSRYLR